MQVAKWGNSLAVRIPAELAKELGIKEGDDITLRAATDEEAYTFLRKDQERRAWHRRMDEMSRPLPPDYKFDRDEANSR